MTTPVIGGERNLERLLPVEKDAIAIHNEFDRLAILIRSYLLRNFDYLSSKVMQDRSYLLLSRLLDLSKDYDRFFEVVM